MTAVARASSAKPVIGDRLLHPVALAAICVLLVNDHVLKAAYPGFVTGKLSDFAGLIFFPLFLTAIYEFAATLARRDVRTDRLPLLVAIVATGVLFSAIKLVPEVNDVVRHALGVAQWVIVPAGAAMPTHIVMDPTDLVALPALAVAYVIGSVRRPRAGRE